MSKSKQSVYQHEIDEDGIELFRRNMPRGWKIREYRPDYGLDFAIEVFSQPDPNTKARETLGEHFFVQLKSTRSPDLGTKKLFARGNVEKSKEHFSDEFVAKIEVCRIDLEVAELLTVERMGSAIPVLLVVADLENDTCYFVCLNDYIDKILIARFEDYTQAQGRRVLVPLTNALDSPKGTVALRWYAKRAKLFAAFQRFTFQYSELQQASEAEWKGLATHFAKLISRYDFWDDVEMCEIIGHYRDALHRFTKTGRPYLLGGIPLVSSPTKHAANKGYSQKEDTLKLWQGLAVLPKNYEDIWREWFLPTSLGHITSEISGEE